jgi:hypothetical protein
VVVVAAPASADGGNGGAFPGGAGGMGFTGADGNAIDAAVVGLHATTVAAATKIYLAGSAAAPTTMPSMSACA